MALGRFIFAIHARAGDDRYGAAAPGHGFALRMLKVSADGFETTGMTEKHSISGPSFMGHRKIPIYAPKYAPGMGWL